MMGQQFFISSFRGKPLDEEECICWQIPSFLTAVVAKERGQFQIKPLSAKVSTGKDSVSLWRRNQRRGANILFLP